MQREYDLRGRELQPVFHALLYGQVFHFGTDDLADVEQLPGQFGTRIIQLRHFEHIVDERSEELRIVADDLYELPALFLREVLPGNQLGKAALWH